MPQLVNHVTSTLVTIAFLIGCGGGGGSGSPANTAGSVGVGGNNSSSAGGAGTQAGASPANGGTNTGSGGANAGSGNGAGRGGSANTASGGQAPDTGMGNPVFSGWYADPDVRLFGNTYYIYPTHSVEYSQQTYFEAFSSTDFQHWTSVGHVLELSDISWSGVQGAWAPTATEHKGKYWFYFASATKNSGPAAIGVAVADSPHGPFKDAKGTPLIPGNVGKAEAIDPMVFIDDDKQPYLYFGGSNHILVAKLADDMISIVGDWKDITPSPEVVEGSWVLKRKGVYYLTWSENYWSNDSYSAAYGTGPSPMGPFTRVGTFLSTNAAVGNGPGHNSVINLPGTDEWYVVYHRRPANEGGANNRVTCIDRLVFNDDGSIAPVVLTNTGPPLRPISN